MIPTQNFYRAARHPGRTDAELAATIKPLRDAFSTPRLDARKAAGEPQSPRPEPRRAHSEPRRARSRAPKGSLRSPEGVERRPLGALLRCGPTRRRGPWSLHRTR